METTSGKRKRAVLTKSKKRIGKMHGDDLDDNVGDYLDFISHISKGDGMKNTGEEENSYLHDESLLLSPVLTDYVNRSNLSSSTSGCDPNISKTIPFSESRCLEKDIEGQQIENNVLGEDNIASSPVRRENLHSAWQLDASTCPSLGLGSPTSAESSQNTSEIHNGTRDSLTNECEDSKTSENFGYKISKCSESGNDDGTRRNEQLLSKIRNDDNKNCTTDIDREAVSPEGGGNQDSLSCKDIDDGYVQNYKDLYPYISKDQGACDKSDRSSVIKNTDYNSSPLKNDQSSSSTSVESPKLWFSRLSSVVPHTRQEKGRDCVLLGKDDEQGQASDSELENEATDKQPQHNAGNKEAIKHEDKNNEELRGGDSWSTPSPDGSCTSQQYSEETRDTSACPKTIQSLQHEEGNSEGKIKIVDDNEDKVDIVTCFSPIVGTPKSKLSHKKLMDSVETNTDNIQDGNQIMLAESISQTWKNFVQKLTPSKESKNKRTELSPVLKNYVLDNNLLCDQRSRLSLQNNSTQFGDHEDKESTNSRFSMELSLTPALKRLRSRMMGNTSEGDMDVADGSKTCSEKHITFENQGEDCLKTPTNTSAENALDRVNTPSTLEKSGLNLTPALQALKSRINLYSSDEDCATPQSFNTPKSLLKKSDISTSKSPNTPLDEDDLYLEQPNDLSSAKKKLTAQSSALVERLRGAAQRRKMQLSRSRNSIVAREQKYLMTLETNDDLIYSPDAGCVDLNEENEARSPIMKTPYQPFKARPLPATTSERNGGHSGVPKVRKRPTTVPKSPMLGSRRINKIESSNTRKQVVGKIHARVPASTGMIVSGGLERVSKTKKRIMSLPNTPYDVPKSKDVETTRSILHSAVSKVNAKPHGNHGRSNTKKKDTRSCSIEKTHLGLRQVSRTRNIDDQENILPFRLHSTIRAGEREKFDNCRILSERRRQEQLNKEREALIRDKHLELSRLKGSLR